VLTAEYGNAVVSLFWYRHLYFHTNVIYSMSKRPSASNFYGQSKKFRATTSSSQMTAIESGDMHTLDVSHLSNTPSDIEAALVYLNSKFPTEKFEGRLPPVVLVHQIYSIIKCKTSVDREIVGTTAIFKYILFVFAFG
jgi:hypothetical protein